MASAPKFSVIIPTRDRPLQLERCLESLMLMRYPRERFEVVVVNDGDAPASRTVIRRLLESVRTSLVSTGGAGPAAARNAGVAASTGENLAFIDDDCAADESWLVAMEARLVANQDDVIGGTVTNSLTDNVYARASQGLQDFVYAWYHTERRGDLRFFTTNNLVVSRATFTAIGGFDASFPFASEDRDWCDRALLGGHDLIHAPEAVVRHFHDLTLGSFLKQHYRYGQGAFRFHRARASRRAERVRLEPVKFYIGMLRAPSRTNSPRPIRESALTMASQAASLVGFARELALRLES
ncbi:MAG: glycosyltransferase family 2 protein [Gemmatimonadaceae bacterium]